jgi:glycosyltransferase involved in cell wall biosynthesis
MYAGLENAAGDFIAIMDADLQDPPEMLEEMFTGITEEGYDCVGSRRVTRKGESKLRSFFARQFYRLANNMSATPIVDGARDFRLMTRQMLNEILRLSEKNRFSKGLFSWVGFDSKWLEYENRERVAGESSWSFFWLVGYSLEGIIAFSTKPLVIASVLGVIACIIALILLIFYFVKAIVYGDPVEGFPTLITVILFLGGLQLLCIGILSQYLAKTYTEAKSRPIYIVKEKDL